MAAPGEGGDAESRGVTHWRCAPFGELTVAELYAILQVRAEVFVVEQACAFQDLDGADAASWHLCGTRSPVTPAKAGAQSPVQLVAYARLIPPGIKFAEVSIGRVVTSPLVRGTGCGRELMERALAEARRLWPGKPIRIGAQRRLERFYASLGFVEASAPYDEDGIEHVEMLLAGTTRERTT